MSDNAEVPQPTRTAIIIEDDPDTGKLISDIFQHSGFGATVYPKGEDAIDSLHEREGKIDIATVDVMLGNGIDGFETIRQNRALSDAYIIMMTSLTDESDIVEGLAIGADQYIQKPFRPHEFSAALKAYLRRIDQPDEAGTDDGLETVHSVRPSASAVGGAAATYAMLGSTASISARGAVAPVLERVGEQRTDTEPADPQEYERSWIEYNGLRLNTLSRELLVNGREVQLTKTEFNLMTLLLQSGRRVRSRASLALELHMGKRFVSHHVVTDAECRSIEVHLANLRKKIGDSSGGPHWIQTVRGVGYKLAKPIEP